MKFSKFTVEDTVAFRDFLARVPPEKIFSVMRKACPIEIDINTVLSNNADGVARAAAMKAGWEAYEKILFSLLGEDRKAPEESQYKDMS